jgi:hypothetical protein
MNCSKPDNERERCVHCLRSAELLEKDHVFPSSWYPDSTPPTVQRWTVPSCPECNRKLGQLEKDLLIRLMLCIDPKSYAASGLHSKVLSSLGLDSDKLPDKEHEIRNKLRDKLRYELLLHAEVAELPGKIPGLGPTNNESVQWAMPIPWAGLSIIIEKIVRGCEYKLKHRFIEPPYCVRTFVDQPYDDLPEPYASAASTIDMGPGCIIRRVFAAEDTRVVLYWMTIWNSLYFHACVDDEAEFQSDKQIHSYGGIALPENRAMSISDYLRNLNNQEPDKK